MEILKRLSPSLLIGIIAALLFVPLLGSVHLFDWDEINFAESAREMILTGNYAKVQVNFRPFWEKPPLFIWMQALSMKVFGVNEFAARFPNVICGFLTLMALFHLGRKYFNARLGWLWVLAFLGSFTPHLYFKTGIIDPWFNLFIFLSLMMIAEGSTATGKQRSISFLLGGLFIGLALLTKGPVSILVILLCLGVMLVWRRFKFFFNFKDVVIYSLACIAVSFIWYGVEVMKNGLWFIQEFIQYQQELASQSVATHGQPWYYHPLVLLFGAFPASVIAIPGFYRSITENDEQKMMRQWMLILFWVVLILFSIVKTKIIHYSSLCYIPLTFLAAYTMEQVLAARAHLAFWNKLLFLIVGLTVSAAFIVLPLVFLVDGLKGGLVGLIRDPFAQANLMLPVQWSWIAVLPGIVLLAAVVYGTIKLIQRQAAKAFTGIFLGGLFTIQGFLIAVVPALEQHTQGTAIEFLEALEQKDAYVETLGYKSYAQYFYAATPKIGDRADYRAYRRSVADRYQNLPARDIPAMAYRDWLIHGNIDKPAFFISKIQQREEFEAMENLEVIGQKGGFVFYRRINVRE